MKNETTKVIALNPKQIPHCSPVNPLLTAWNADLPTNIITTWSNISKRQIKINKKLLLILTKILKESSITLQFN